MTIPQKTALSLLIAVVLAAGFSLLAFTGFFNLIETRFYNPSITNSLSKEVERDAGAVENFLDEAREHFAEALSVDAVQRSFLPNQSAQDIFERTRVYGMLMESQKGLQSVRFVDAGGLRIHFSTDSADILSRNAETISYKNYDESLPFVPYRELAVSPEGKPKITLDGQNERIIFSFPFSDSLDVYRGTAMYSLSVRAVTERLIADGRIKIGENFSIVSNPPGMVSGLPGSLDAAEAVVPVVSSIWREGLLNLTAMDSAASGSSLALISAKTPQGLFVGKVVDESLFEFPQSMKVILLAAIFLTVFLSIFLAFNLQPDTITVVQNRLKNLQISLIREYYERKGEMDWNHWYRELEQRREDVRVELKRGIKEKPALLEDIDSLIDKSWDEILTAIGGKRETRLAIDEDKLQVILSRMLAAMGTMPFVSGTGTSAASGAATLLSPAELGKAAEALPEEPLELEELSEVEDLEDMEEIGDTEGTTVAFGESSGADDVEELEEVEELDVLEEVPAGEPGQSVHYTPPAAVKSNIQLVFGEDDIPTIVETSGLELVDDLTGEDDIISELDEADELDEAEELEELEEVDDTDEDDLPAEERPSISEIDVASQIEFGTPGKQEDGAESIDESEFDIISPFSTMFSGLNGDDTLIAQNDDEKTDSGFLEEISGSLSLVHVPFQDEDKSEPEELPSEDPSVIKQKNGVNYVDKKVKTPDQETSQSLDPGLKNLVDSVIGKKQAVTGKKQALTGKKQAAAGKKQAPTEKKQAAAAKKQTPAGKKQTSTGKKQTPQKK